MRPFFHLQACHKSRKKAIPPIMHDGIRFSVNQAKSEVIYNYFNEILRKPFQRQHSIVLTDLLPQLDLSGLDACFSEQEVWETVRNCLVIERQG